MDTTWIFVLLGVVGWPLLKNEFLLDIFVVDMCPIDQEIDTISEASNTWYLWALIWRSHLRLFTLTLESLFDWIIRPHSS